MEGGGLMDGWMDGLGQMVEMADTTAPKLDGHFVSSESRLALLYLIDESTSFSGRPRPRRKHSLHLLATQCVDPSPLLSPSL